MFFPGLNYSPTELWSVHQSNSAESCNMKEERREEKERREERSGCFTIEAAIKKKQSCGKYKDRRSVRPSLGRPSAACFKTSNNRYYAIDWITVWKQIKDFSDPLFW